MFSLTLWLTRIQEAAGIRMSQTISISLPRLPMFRRLSVLASDPWRGKLPRRTSTSSGNALGATELAAAARLAGVLLGFSNSSPRRRRWDPTTPYTRDTQTATSRPSPPRTRLFHHRFWRHQPPSCYQWTALPSLPLLAPSLREPGALYWLHRHFLVSPTNVAIHSCCCQVATVPIAPSLLTDQTCLLRDMMLLHCP